MNSCPQKGGDLAIPTENFSIYFLPIFYFELQSKTKQKVEWAAIFRVTISLKT